MSKCGLEKGSIKNIIKTSCFSFQGNGLMGRKNVAFKSVIGIAVKKKYFCPSI